MIIHAFSSIYHASIGMSIKKKIFYWKFDDTLLFKADCAILWVSL